MKWYMPVLTVLLTLLKGLCTIGASVVAAIVLIWIVSNFLGTILILAAIVLCYYVGASWK